LPEFAVSEFLPVDVAQAGIPVRRSCRLSHFYGKYGRGDRPRSKQGEKADEFSSREHRCTYIATHHRSGGIEIAAGFSDLVTWKLPIMPMKLKTADYFARV